VKQRISAPSPVPLPAPPGIGGHRVEGPGYLVWYETREEAQDWAKALQEAHGVPGSGGAVQAGGDRSRHGQDPEGTPHPFPVPCLPHGLGSGVPSHPSSGRRASQAAGRDARGIGAATKDG